MVNSIIHIIQPRICRHPPESKLPFEAGLQISWKALHEVRMFANVYMCGLQEFCLHAKLQMDFITLDQRGKNERRVSPNRNDEPMLHFRLCDESLALLQSMLSIGAIPRVDLSPAEPKPQRKRSCNGSTDLRPKDECSRSIAEQSNHHLHS